MFSKHLVIFFFETKPIRKTIFFKLTEHSPKKFLNAVFITERLLPQRRKKLNYCVIFCLFKTLPVFPPAYLIQIVNNFHRGGGGGGGGGRREEKF